MNLITEEADRIKSGCLSKLREIGTVPDDDVLVIDSGSLGIRKLGCVDFLSQCGYRVVWRHGRRRFK